jgi:hypothetical protein
LVSRNLKIINGDINQIHILIPICFIAGMFPVKTISSIIISTTTWMSEKFTNFSGFGLKKNKKMSLSIDLRQLLPNEIVERFREEGVYSVQELATSDIINLCRQTPFNISKLIDWQDQAMLLCCIGTLNCFSEKNDNKSNFDILSRNGINRYSDLYYLYQLSKDKNILTKIEKDFDSSIILNILIRKGEIISQHLSNENISDVRLAAFYAWYISPDSISKCLKN